MDMIGIELEQAIALIIENINEIKDTEIMSVPDAEGRILAQDIYAEFDQPPFPRSPLDGYTFHADAVKGASQSAPVLLPVTDTVYAGACLIREIPFGEAVKITTGAAIPDGCNCVIRQEDIKTDGTNISVSMELHPYDNYCFAGEDFKKGSQLLSDGDRLRFIEMGILASAGHAQVNIYRRPRIAVFATGDELIEPGQPLTPGMIYDSNLYMIQGRLRELGVDVICAEQLMDEPEVAAARILAISAAADAIITTGGVSMGEKDIFHQILPLLGCQRLFWRVLMKPGTPAMFSLLNGTPLLSLSGNPFAAATTFELLARPILSRLSGADNLAAKHRTAVLANTFDKESKGRRFIRAGYEAETGLVTVPDVRKHASGILASMKGCNCLIDIPADTKRIQSGDTVRIWLL